MVEKTLHDIRIIETKTVLVDDKRVTLDPVPSDLSSKVEECLHILGHSNIITLEIVAELLSRGRVRIQFREYSEIVELADKRDIQTLAGAAKLYEDYMSGLHGFRPRPPSIGATTQRIRVQPPKVELPKPKPPAAPEPAPHTAKNPLRIPLRP